MSKRSNPKFLTKLVRPLFEAKIPDLKALKEAISGSLLVSIDIESSPQGVREIGFALLKVNKDQTPQFPEDNDIRTFAVQNAIQAQTIQVEDRIIQTDIGERIQFGSRVVVDADELNTALIELLTDFTHDNTSPLVLVLFGMYTEFEWMARACPELCSFFTAWVDVQDITAQRAGVPSPGLIKSLDAIPMTNRRPGTRMAKQHCAANDAVRSLAVLCRHVCLDPPLTLLPTAEKEPFPRRDGMCPGYGEPFTARLKPAGSSHLPREIQTSRGLADLFAKYEPKSVAINQSPYARSNGVKIWWISFANIDCLRTFVTEVEGSTLLGEKIAVKGFVASKTGVEALSVE